MSKNVNSVHVLRSNIEGTRGGIVPGTKITGVRFDSTVFRSPIAPTGGDNFHMTWAANGDQYASLDDGYGWWSDHNYNTRLVRIYGDSPPYYGVDRDVGEYPLLEGRKGWYGFGCIAIGDDLYQFISRLTGRDLPEGCKLAYKMADSNAWLHHDGTPLSFGAADPHFFWHRENGAFGWVTILQMGRGYELNTDGYVYVYSHNGRGEGTMNQITLARVRKENILAPNAYEHFQSRDAGGDAQWTSRFSSGNPVVTFPSGWVPSDFAFAWTPYVIYNPGLRTYMMMASGNGKDNGTMFNAPDCLVMYQAPSPWGPWRLFYKDDHWIADVDYKKWLDENNYVDDDIYAHEPEPELTRLYSPVVSPRWISEDGKTLWFIYSDYKKWLQFDHKQSFNYRFNMQKVMLEGKNLR